MTDIIPTKTTYRVPIPEINNPPIDVPMVVPILQADKNIPLEKSGASGAAEVTKY